MIRLPHTCRLQHGDPVLEAQQVSLTNFRRTEPIVFAVVSTHHGISQPIRFGLPAIGFWLVSSLSRSLSTPFNSRSDRGYRLSHMRSPRGQVLWINTCEQVKCHDGRGRRNRSHCSYESVDLYVNLASYDRGSCL